MASTDPASVTVRELSEGEGFTIPAGQFALLLTKEIIEVPADALAFVSIRARTKFKGLVNVSGFHVDPGFKGQFTFAVFNAGPSIIHLRQGQDIFVIWYASLDCKSSSIKSDPVRMGIDPDIIQGISGELESFASLSDKIKTVDIDLGTKVHAIEKEQAFYRAVVLWAVPLIIAIAVAVTVAVTSWALKEAPRDQAVKAEVTVSRLPAVQERPISTPPEANAAASQRPEDGRK